MTLLVDLPTEIEARVHEAAEAQRIDPAAYVRETLTASHPFPTAPASMTEKELLEEINRGFSEAFWERFRHLVRRRRAETVTLAEQQEAIRMFDRTEARSVERLRCLLELSSRRGKSVDELMTELGIRPVSLD